MAASDFFSGSWCGDVLYGWFNSMDTEVTRQENRKCEKEGQCRNSDFPRIGIVGNARMMSAEWFLSFAIGRSQR